MVERTVAQHMVRKAIALIIIILYFNNLLIVQLMNKEYQYLIRFSFKILNSQLEHT